MKTSADMLDRMENLVRRMASMNIQHPGYTHKFETGEATVLFAPIADYQEARAIVAELPEPVDPDLASARNIVAEAQGYDADGQRRAKRYLAGDWDTDTAVQIALAALRRAREEGVR